MSKETKKEKEVGAEAIVESPTVVPAQKVDIAKASATDIEITKKELDSQEQIHFMVPLMEGEKVGAVHECFINGYRVAVPKGVMTTVPKSIALLLAETYNIGTTAGSEFRVDSDEKKQDALS